MMTFDYIYYLIKEEVENPSSSEQWAGQYHWFSAIGQKKEKADPLREAWKNQYLQDRQVPGEVIAGPEWRSRLGLDPSPETLPALDSLSTNSFLIHFTFTLQKPYLSKDDNDFHIIDNPLVREKVFRWPMVRPSGWKGSLRHALWQLGYQEDDEQIRRIFGETRGDNTGQAGRLYLYPTFFDKSGLEIINPHDREKRVGKNPLLLECVPADKATGAFTLLYVPFDRIGEDVGETRRQVAADLQLVAEGLRAMMTTYGFGAKTSSGFGLAALTGEGKLVINYPDLADGSMQPIEPALPASVQTFRAVYPDEDFILKPNEWRTKHGATNREKDSYKEAKADWLAYQERLAIYQQRKAVWEKYQKTPPPPTTTCPFTSFEALEREVKALVKRWQVEEADA